MDSLLSFPVGLFHPLQHAGLSRRSPVCRRIVSNRVPDWRVAFGLTSPRLPVEPLFFDARSVLSGPRFVRLTIANYMYIHVV